MLCIILISLLYVNTVSANIKPDIKNIITQIDNLYRGKSSYAEIEMTIINPNWQRTLKINAWTEGMDKTLIKILSPKKDAGITTLKIGNEMWNFFPKLNRVMKVPPSMMMGSWMGSDFTNDDLVKESTLLNDYTYKLITTEEKEPAYYNIELIPKKDTPSVWGKIIITVNKVGYIPIAQKYYDEKGKLIRVLNFKEVKNFNGTKIPSVLEMTHLNKEGSKTIIRYKELNLEIRHSPGTFSIRNLQK